MSTDKPLDPRELEAERAIYDHFKRLGCFDPAKETKELINALAMIEASIPAPVESVPAPAGLDLEAIEAVLDFKSDTWYPAFCEKCGWAGSSELCNGGECIGYGEGYSDVTCPRCNAQIDELNLRRNLAPFLIAEVRRLRAALSPRPSKETGADAREGWQPLPPHVMPYPDEQGRWMCKGCSVNLYPGTGWACPTPGCKSKLPAAPGEERKGGDGSPEGSPTAGAKWAIADAAIAYVAAEEAFHAGGGKLSQQHTVDAAWNALRYAIDAHHAATPEIPSQGAPARECWVRWKTKVPYPSIFEAIPEKPHHMTGEGWEWVRMVESPVAPTQGVEAGAMPPSNIQCTVCGYFYAADGDCISCKTESYPHLPKMSEGGDADTGADQGGAR